MPLVDREARSAETTAEHAPPGGVYALTVSSSWEVEWSGGGESGVIPLGLVNSRDVAVRDRAVVLVP